MDKYEEADLRRRQLVREAKRLTRESKRLEEMLDYPEKRRTLDEFYQRRGFPAEQATNTLRRRLADLEVKDREIRDDINQLLAFIMDADPK
jgi:hypothetical protein